MKASLSYKVTVTCQTINFAFIMIFALNVLWRQSSEVSQAELTGGTGGTAESQVASCLFLTALRFGSEVRCAKPICVPELHELCVHELHMNKATHLR